MNKKHIAVIVVVCLILAMAQGTLWMNNRLTTMQAGAKKASDAAVAASTSLNAERAKLITLTTDSAELMEFLQSWQPHFEAVNSPEAAELNISMGIREDNLLTLSQRYESVGQRGNATIPRLMRANITFEDEYAKVMNWFGKLESRLPAARVSNVRLSRGTGAGDIKMDIILEVPLLGPRTATSTPATTPRRGR